MLNASETSSNYLEKFGAQNVVWLYCNVDVLINNISKYSEERVKNNISPSKKRKKYIMQVSFSFSVYTV